MRLERADRVGYAAVLVDIVDSRHHADRVELQRRVTAAAAAVGDRLPALDPFALTVGDELQATFADLLVAIRAASELRLELTGAAALRVGIGWGEIVLHDPTRSPFGQDGPAWWAARAALDRVAASTPWSGYDARFGIEFAGPSAADPPPTATTIGRGLPAPRPLSIDVEITMRSLLALLDRALATVDAVEARIVLGDLAGRSTEAIAAELDLTASAVSQRRRRNHLRELVAALGVIDAAPRSAPG